MRKRAPRSCRGSARGGALVLVHTNDDGAAPHDEEKLAGCGLGPFDHPSAVPQPGVFLGSGIVINARADMLSSSSKELERLEALLEEPRRQNRPTTSELAFVAPVDHALRAASAGLLAFALAVAGPVIFWRLRRRGAARVFPALALTSIAGFAGMLVLGRVLRPTAGTTTVVFHETTSGETSAYTVRTRAFASPSGPVRTRRAVPGSLLGTDIHGGRGTFRLEPDGTIVLNERQPPATDHVYLVESTLERLPGPITIACSSESCSIDNATGAPLDHAQLYVPTRGVFDLGTIDVHKSVSLAFPDASSLRESLEHRYLARSGVTASLVARRRGDEAEASIVGVACVTGCEALR